jgi:ferredoxin-NADP reductase
MVYTYGMDTEVTFQSKKEVALDVWEYSFSSDAEVEFVPGQYAKFFFPFEVADPRGKQHRTFSLTSLPTEPYIRFITRLDAPLSTYKQHLAALRPGDTMRMREPMGDCVLPRLESIPLVFVAQGIALASYLAMFHACAGQKLRHPLTLLWARRSEDNRLENLIPSEITLGQVNFIYPKRLLATDILEYLADDSLIYLSGSQKFVETLGAELESHGVPRARLIYDYYSGYSDL